ncbi:NAD(P)/FAD-dependent oxidoreductase [Synechococcus sp. RSCCF101]|uniref:NAD(P)/FAD-dependent oxidoreductase n=1 Tax=Synechococcus sp. RSCCF101 TaxID=2511069 RepID=UPI001246B52F|nr:FAD/NAD(P)-binding oxidoreductase [Synechococcus sp. RSCCF101]QEY31444.1 NAD(P)/FAD-dependent oxidoreductase [Synechococcus sp. RSCCF101]
MAEAHATVLIAGGGTGGITLASWLRRLRPDLDVAVIEPSEAHDYQSGWVLVAGGFIELSSTRRSEASVMPAGVRWIRAAVDRFDPFGNRVQLSDGDWIGYDVLVVALGLQLRWESVKGLPESLGRHGITSIYRRELAMYTRDCLSQFRGGTAIFTHPKTAIKCGGAPQKIMHLAQQQFQSRSGVGVRSRLLFCTAQPALFPVAAYSDKMVLIADERGEDVRYHRDLVGVNGPERLATFRVDEPGSRPREEIIPFDMLHVVPPMTAPSVVARSPLVDAPDPGWVAVDPNTAQHRHFANVFAIGDVGSFPTAKTAAAVRLQAPVVADHVIAVLDKNPLLQWYQGYSACPLITSDHSVMLLEFDYTHQPVSSFLVNPVKERWLGWLLERFAFPWIYWNRMLRGLPHEGGLLEPFQGLARRLGLMRWQRPSSGD